MIPKELADLGVILWESVEVNRDSGGPWMRHSFELADGRRFGGTYRGPSEDIARYIAGAIRKDNQRKSEAEN